MARTHYSILQSGPVIYTHKYVCDSVISGCGNWIHWLQKTDDMLAFIHDALLEFKSDFVTPRRRKPCAPAALHRIFTPNFNGTYYWWHRNLYESQAYKKWGQPELTRL